MICPFTMDNYSVGVKLKEMHGEHSNVQLEGTQEMAQLVIPFSDTTWDREHVELDYLPVQDKPSPLLMPAYDAYTESSIAAFFLNHRDMPLSNRPCMSGFRMESYHSWLIIRKLVPCWA